MATTTTIYKSVLLQPGEQFTLPPGAELISATDTDSITSTCDISDLQGLNCYTFVFGNAGTDGDQSQLFESETPDKSNVKIIGISVDGIDYLFNSAQYSQDDDGRYLDPDLINAINGTAAGQVMFEPEYGYWIMNDNGTMNYITFKGVPAIVKTLSLIFSAYVADSFVMGPVTPARTEANTTVKFYIKAVDTDSLSGYTNVPECN